MAIVTTLPVGTWIKYRYRGGFQYAKLIHYGRPPKLGIEIGRYPRKGEMYQPVVWKGDFCVEPRGKMKEMQDEYVRLELPSWCGK